jgi:hypothetical protein
VEGERVEADRRVELRARRRRTDRAPRTSWPSPCARERPPLGRTAELRSRTGLRILRGPDPTAQSAGHLVERRPDPRALITVRAGYRDGEFDSPSMKERGWAMATRGTQRTAAHAPLARRR